MHTALRVVSGMQDPQAAGRDEGRGGGGLAEGSPKERCNHAQDSSMVVVPLRLVFWHVLHGCKSGFFAHMAHTTLQHLTSPAAVCRTPDCLMPVLMCQISLHTGKSKHYVCCGPPMLIWVHCMTDC